MDTIAGYNNVSFLSKYDDRFDPNAKAALIIKKCPNSTAIKYKKDNPFSVLSEVNFK